MAFAISEGKSVVSIGDLQIRTKDNDGKIIYENDPQKAVSIALHEARKYIEKFR